MSQRNTLIAAGSISFVLFLLLLPPARILATAAESMDIQLRGISGTLWHGQARSIRVQGLELRDTDWEIAPLSLLLGRLGMDFRSKLPGGFASGHLTLSIGGVLSISNLELAAAINPLAALAGMPAAAGDLSARFEHLEVADGWFRSAVGIVRAGNYPLLPATASKPAVTAGFEVVFDTDELADDRVLRGLVQDLDGPFEVSAELILTPPANYELNGRIAARPGTPARLSQALQLLGPASPQGGYEFSLAGSL